MRVEIFPTLNLSLLSVLFHYVKGAGWAVREARLLKQNSELREENESLRQVDAQPPPTRLHNLAIFIQALTRNFFFINFFLIFDKEIARIENQLFSVNKPNKRRPVSNADIITPTQLATNGAHFPLIRS